MVEITSLTTSHPHYHLRAYSAIQGPGQVGLYQPPKIISPSIHWVALYGAFGIEQENP